MKHLRIKNKYRFIFSLFLIFAIFHSIINFVNSKVFSYQLPQYEEVVVSEGDTLWSLACPLKGKIQENVYQIQKINQLEDCHIYVGQRLKLPISN